MGFILPMDYDWITSLKPSKGQESSDCNQLLKSTELNIFNFKYLNKSNEIKFHEPIGTLIENGFQNRPSLRNLIENIETEIGFVSNSDIRPIINENFKHELHNNSPKIWLGRRHDIEPLEDILEDKKKLFKIVDEISFRQSPFTVDLFIFNRKAISLLLEESWIDDYFLGSIGIDMRIADFACKQGIAARYDSFIKVIHPNHENYRISFVTNVVLDIKDNINFSKKRAKNFDAKACSINIAYWPPFFQKIALIRFFISTIDSRINRLKNLFQYKTSYISNILCKIYAHNKINFKMYMIFRFLLPLPTRGSNKGFSKIEDASIDYIKNKLINNGKSINNN